jgi:hypothetical protein
MAISGRKLNRAHVLANPKGMDISKSEAPRKTYKWYSNWRNEQFCCSHCGWSGLGAEAFPDEVGMMECPHCDHGVGYVQFPSLRDTEKAAALDSAEAIRDLPEEREWLKRLERPDLSGRN